MSLGLEKGVIMTMSRALAALSMRETVIDTETTGLDPLDRHRIVEIEAVELEGAPIDGERAHSSSHRSAPTDACSRQR
jgi:DNA polymerase III epsilon subunit-like protein